MNVLIIVAIGVFIVMALCIILFTILFSVAGIQIIKLLKEARQIGRRAKMLQIFIRDLISKII